MNEYALQHITVPLLLLQPQSFATAGFDVTLVDVGQAQLDRGMKAIHSSLAACASA